MGFYSHKYNRAAKYFTLLLLLSHCFITYSQNSTDSKQVAFYFLTQDSIPVEVYRVMDDSHLNGYKALVSTPICEEEQCYAVQIYIYWDVIGRFMKYELIQNSPLTKFDHEPFNTTDYNKLTKLLKTERPTFYGMSKKDLITDVVNDSLDAYTGATVAAIENEVVSGAAYSCFVLWHITHGAVSDSIKNHSSQHITLPLINNLIKENSDEAYYYLIHYLDEHNIFKFKTQVLEIITKGQGYIPKNTIEILPLSLLNDTYFQESLSLIYPTLDYYAQMSLLQKLDHRNIQDKMALVLIQHIDTKSHARNQSIINIVCSSEQLIDKNIINTLQDKLVKNKIKPNKLQRKRIKELLKKY